MRVLIENLENGAACARAKRVDGTDVRGVQLLNATVTSLEGENSLAHRVAGHGPCDCLTARINAIFPVAEEENTVLDEAATEGRAELISDQRLARDTRAIAEPV